MAALKLRRLFLGATLVAVVVALYSALVYTPREQVMGDRIRIAYVHIGAAWTAYLAYAVTGVAALAYLWRRDRRWDWVALASAEWGIVLTTVTLVTGSLWGRAVNGWWWDWGDVRLTLTLLLWFLYVGYATLRHFTEGDARATLSAVLALAGVPAMVLNHFAVRLFPRSHPTSVFAREGGPAVAEPILVAVLLSLLAYTLVYAYVLAMRVRLEATRDRAAASAFYQP